MQEKASLEKDWQGQLSEVEDAAEMAKQAAEGKISRVLDEMHNMAKESSYREAQQGRLILTHITFGQAYAEPAAIAKARIGASMHNPSPNQDLMGYLSRSMTSAGFKI